MVIRMHARVASMVRGSCIVDQTKGSNAARKTVKMIQYSTIQSFRGCLGSMMRRKHTMRLMAKLAIGHAGMIQSGGASPV